MINECRAGRDLVLCTLDIEQLHLFSDPKVSCIWPRLGLALWDISISTIGPRRVYMSDHPVASGSWGAAGKCSLGTAWDDRGRLMGV